MNIGGIILDNEKQKKRWIEYFRELLYSSCKPSEDNASYIRCANKVLHSNEERDK
ncbi:hypothetical protein DPMN_105240 [Dreissena polymorpha]|uniref:Uncharacterized protein n=1 Tax=Dreissena polymorpha TaxID=45954 RepID=A0A9D4K315_DREPO|nr:hypothetical protein DPMN_105240 [Dreissena polymorpha]